MKQVLSKGITRGKSLTVLIIMAAHVCLQAQFTVAFWGDSRSNSGNAMAEISAYLVEERDKTVDVHWQNGDFTQGGSVDNWNSSWNISNVREACVKDYFYMCTSNHDDGDAYQGQLADILPSNGNNVYYSMTSWDIPGSARQVHLLMFDLYMSGTQEQIDYFTPLLAQVDPDDWIAAMWHAPSFNGFTYKTEEGGAKDEFMKLLETSATGGDFVLNGHAHQYRRTHVLDWDANVLESVGGPGTSHTSPSNSSGLVHIVNGRGGVFDNNSTGENWYGNAYAPTLTNPEGLISLMVFDDNVMTMRTIIVDENGEKGVQDTWTWTRGDPSGPQLPASLVVVSEGGTVSRSVETPDTYPWGTEVILTATPNEGYLFEGWSGDLTGNQNPVTVRMTSDRNITANFKDCTAGCAVDVGVSASVTVEENLESNAVNSSSSDLELSIDGAEQLVGLTFTGLELPQGAEITSAHIQFSVDEVTTGSVTLNIYGEKIENSPVFVTTNSNVSDRQATTASVEWSPDNWNTVGESGEAQQTSDISAIIQEIVDQPGWASGNNLSIMIERAASDGGSNKRTATKSVQLVLTYAVGGITASEIEFKKALIVSPTIIAGKLELPLYMDIYSVTVFDVTGRKRFYSDVGGGQKSVDLKGLEQGRYLVRLYTNDGFINQSIMNFSY